MRVFVAHTMFLFALDHFAPQQSHAHIGGKVTETYPCISHVVVVVHFDRSVLIVASVANF